MKTAHLILTITAIATIAYFLLVGRKTEAFFGMSPGTLTQLQSTHVPTIPYPGSEPKILLGPLQHRFRPWDMSENSALLATPVPYLIY